MIKNMLSEDKASNSAKGEDKNTDVPKNNHSLLLKINNQDVDLTKRNRSETQEDDCEKTGSKSPVVNTNGSPSAKFDQEAIKKKLQETLNRNGINLAKKSSHNLREIIDKRDSPLIDDTNNRQVILK